MTNYEFRWARRTLGLSRKQLGKAFNRDYRFICAVESGEQGVTLIHQALLDALKRWKRGDQFPLYR